MTRRKIATGVVHRLPPDLRDAVFSDSKAFDAWEDLTPSPAMNGYVGLSLPSSRRRGLDGWSEPAPSCWRQSVGGVVDRAARTVELVYPRPASPRPGLPVRSGRLPRSPRLIR